MGDAQKGEILRKLYEIDPSQKLMNEFVKDPDEFMKNAPKRLEGYRSYTDKYESFDDFVGDRDKILAKLYNSQDGVIPSGARMYSFREKHPDISEEDIVAWFNKTNQYKEDELKARQYEADRMKRAKEVKDLNFVVDALVSDYSKKRYIDDPTTSVLGGRQFNPYSSEGHKEIRDQILGATAAATDFVPGLGGVLTGPVIRAGRDALHNDEKYKPEGTPVSNFIKDVGFNAGVEYLPTAVHRKLTRAEKGGSKTSSFFGDAYYNSVIDEELAVNREARNLAQEALKKKEFNGLAEKDLWNDIRRLPDSEFKTLVEAELAKGKRPSAALNQVEFKYKTFESEPVRELNEKLAERGSLYTSNNTSTPLIRKDVLKPELTPLQDWMRVAMRGGSKVGPGAVKAVGAGKAREVNSDEALKEWYKSNYARDWAMDFAPHYKEGDPLWEAFKESYPERAAKIEEKEKNK